MSDYANIVNEQTQTEKAGKGLSENESLVQKNREKEYCTELLCSYVNLQ